MDYPCPSPLFRVSPLDLDLVLDDITLCHVTYSSSEQKHFNNTQQQHMPHTTGCFFNGFGV